MTRLLRLPPLVLVALAGREDDPGPNPTDAGPRDMAAAPDSGTTADGAGLDGAGMAKDPAMAPKMPVNRFSDAAGMLMRRSPAPMLPGPDQPIDFEEKVLMGAAVPTSPTYVAFNTNPTEPGGEPGSGFRTESGSEQTHNVVATVPSDSAYSPPWPVNVYDNAAFAAVAHLATALAAPQLGAGVAKVNCPVVEVK